MKPIRKVSVIIPTYQNWDALMVCLQALENQTYPKSHLEVIIINNDGRESVPAGFPTPGYFKIVDEIKPGSYAARNTGIRQATGEILAFTDSDCIPDPDWVENGVRLLELHPSGRIAGNVKLSYTDVHRPSVAELYEQVFAFKQASNAKDQQFSVTANMWTWRWVMNKTGYFDEQMFSGGDYEWSRRATSKGFGIAFGENVRVQHHARNTVASLAAKAKRVGAGHVYLYRKSKWDVFTNVIKKLKPPVLVLRHIHQQNPGLPAHQKVMIFLLRYYLGQVSAWEELFIVFGKKPRRQ